MKESEMHHESIDQTQGAVQDLRQQNNDLKLKLSELESLVKSNTSRLSSTRTQVASNTELLNGFDETQARKTIKKFKGEVGNMHELLKHLVTKFCVITELNHLAKSTYPKMHFEIMEKAIASLDKDNAYWDNINTKTLNEIVKMLLREGKEQCLPRL